MDEIIDKLPYNIIKDKYNAFSQIVIASIMEELYSEFNILTLTNSSSSDILITFNPDFLILDK